MKKLQFPFLEKSYNDCCDTLITITDSLKWAVFMDNWIDLNKTIVMDMCGLTDFSAQALIMKDLDKILKIKMGVE